MFVKGVVLAPMLVDTPKFKDCFELLNSNCLSWSGDIEALDFFTPTYSFYRSIRVRRADKLCVSCPGDADPKANFLFLC